MRPKEKLKRPRAIWNFF